LSMRSSWCHDLGTLSCKSHFNCSERLENVIALHIIPCPNGDFAAARKASLLYVRRCFSMSVLSITVSHSVSAGVVLSKIECILQPGLVGRLLQCLETSICDCNAENSEGL
jgi:hypothetical protein